MTPEQKEKIRIKMKEWAEVKKCPKCDRRNALNWYPDGMFVCRWCGYEYEGKRMT